MGSCSKSRRGGYGIKSRVQQHPSECCTGDNYRRNLLIVQRTAAEFTTPCIEHPMDVGNVGEQTPSDATIDNNKNMQEELPSDAATDNDLFCTETMEDPPESHTTDNLRDRNTQPV